jgi:photosystem II stability/assembly factor-like uncharacterized protein
MPLIAIPYLKPEVFMKNTVRIIVFTLLASLPQFSSAEWTKLNTGLADTCILSMLADNGRLFAGSKSGIFLSSNNGTSWATIKGGLPVKAAINALTKNGSTLFAATDTAGIFSSQDSGKNWKAVNNGVPAIDTNRRRFYPVVNFALLGTKLFAGGEGIFFTDNNGANWTQLNAKALGYVISLTAGEYSLLTSVRRYEIREVDGYDSVYRYDETGADWVQINSGLPNLTYLNLHVSTLGAIGTTIFAGTSVWGAFGKGIFRSSNNGTTWIPANAGILDSASINSFFTHNSTIFIGTSLGVFISTNSGLSWTDFNSRKTFDAYSFAVSGNYIFAGSPTSGVWRRPLGEVRILSYNTLKNVQYSADVIHATISRSHQTMVINLTLRRQEKITVGIYDLLGAQVGLPVNRYMEPGKHFFTWNMRGFSKGPCIVKIQAGPRSYSIATPSFFQ